VGLSSCGDGPPAEEEDVSALSSGYLLEHQAGQALSQPTIYQLFYGNWWSETAVGQAEMNNIKQYVNGLVGYINGKGAGSAQVPLLRQYGVLSASAPPPPNPIPDNIGPRDLNVGVRFGQISYSGSTAHFHINSYTFNQNQVGGSITFTGTAHAINNASFTILTVDNTGHDITIRPGQNNPSGWPVADTFGIGVTARISRGGLLLDRDIQNIVKNAQNQGVIPPAGPNQIVMVWVGYDLVPNMCEHLDGNGNLLSYAPPVDANCEVGMWGTYHGSYATPKQAYGTVFERPGQPTATMLYFVGHEIIEGLTDPYINVDTGWEGLFDYSVNSDATTGGVEICDWGCADFTANGVTVPGMLDNSRLGCATNGYINGWYGDNPPAGPGSGFNLASQKPAQALFLDGSQAMLQAGTPASAVDGDPTTFVQATNQWRWQLQIDLVDLQYIDKVRVTMPASVFATALHVDVSTNGTTFTTAATRTGLTGGGPTTISFTARAARFVRIVADKPDGPGQTGVQMALSEVGVYGPPDMALHKNTSALFIDGSGATMQVGSLPEFATDGIASTFAQAANQWRWQLEVELGPAARPVNMALLTMPSSAFATSYHIDLGTGLPSTRTWVTAATITNGAAGTRAIPISGNARWIRVVADKPDGPGQTGGQMGISRLSVFGGQDVAAGATYTAEYLDGSPATMQRPLSNASDGNATTWAQATNQWLWQLKIDWGSARSINQVDIVMPNHAFATAFHIDYSADGTTWSSAALVPNRFFGDLAQVTLSQQRSARAIRIVADAPNGPNQLGTQMGISEVVVSQ
jgi:hypothetical protein